MYGTNSDTKIQIQMKFGVVVKILVLRGMNLAVSKGFCALF